MPIYEYECPTHGRFEIITGVLDDEVSCPHCGQRCKMLVSNVAMVRVHHTEVLPYNDPLRVHDRQRIMKDTAVKKALDRYAESQRYSEGSPYNKLGV